MSDISITTGAVDSGSSPAPSSPAPSPTVTPPSDTGTSGSAPDSSQADSRPLSFAEALERRAAAETAPPPSAVPDPAAATPGASPIETPASPDGAPTTDAPAAPTSGPIPFERHKAALENARTKTREEVTAQLQQQYGEHIRLGETFRENPVQAAIQVLSELQANPVYAPQLASVAARMLANRRGQTQDAMPEADLTGLDANGQQVRFYSDAQQAKRDAWIANRLMQQMRQELAPLQQAHQEAAERQQHEAARQQLTESVQSRLNEWRQRPGFAEHEKDIKTVQAQYAARGHSAWDALNFAYLDVVLPRLQAQAQNRFVTEAARKAAGTTDNPATVSPTPPRRSRSFAEALARAAGETA